MKNLLVFQLIFFMAVFVQAQKIEEVKIGEQIWMKENLNVDKFRNGDPIPQAKTAEEWKKAGEEGKPAWCYYDNKPKNGKKYGKLYNWFAVNDPRGISPEGWHVPTMLEWQSLEKFFGNEIIKKIKSTKGWDYKGNGIDDFGFRALPGGCIQHNNSFGKGFYGFWWSSQEYNEFEAGYVYVPCCEDFDDMNTILNIWSKSLGFSVRCLKD